MATAQGDWGKALPSISIHYGFCNVSMSDKKMLGVGTLEWGPSTTALYHAIDTSLSLVIVLIYK